MGGMKLRVLVTGGAGYIGSHTTLELLEAGHDVAVVDNLSRSSRESLRRVAGICGREVAFFEVDVLDRGGLGRAFEASRPQAVIHFAAFKSVGESVGFPLRYYENNVAGTLSLLDVMRERGVRHLVFSSSCTVYGDPAAVPVTEDAPLSAVNPYGRSKLMMEDIMRDVARAETEWGIVLLRYFNPIGAHPSGRIGEDPRGIPENLLPYVMQVAAGVHPRVRIFGGDYATKDGTGVRDYLHVVDLARAHVAALEHLASVEGCRALNLGTGRGYSVLEVLSAAERAVGRPIPHEIVDRRPGDAACVFADPSRAEAELGWRAERDLDEMVADHWRWQSGHPRGYEG
jgi:UDP-glucose 4-epimerase